MPKPKITIENTKHQSADVKMCGYHGCNVIPPEEGCECIKCNSCTNHCKSCSEPKKRSDEQFIAEIYDAEILKCKLCMQRYADFARQK
jgi:hypothetical protein